MKQYPFSILDSGDTFLGGINTSTIIPPDKVPKYNVSDKVYEVGYGDFSSVLPKADYQVMRTIGLTVLIGLFVLLVILICWFVVTIYTSTELPQQQETAATAASVQMQNIINGGYLSPGTAQGIRTVTECTAANHCVVDVIAGVTRLDCQLSADPGTESTEWQGIDCQLPLITPYYSSLRTSDPTFLDTIGTLDSVQNLSPAQAAAAFNDPTILAVVYDLTAPTSTSSGYVYQTRLYKAKDILLASGQHSSGLDMTEIRNFAIPFNWVTHAPVLFVRDLQDLYLGNVLTLSYARTPELSELLRATGENVYRIPPGTSYTTSDAYELFNFGELTFKLSTSSSSTTTPYVPYGGVANTTIQVSNI